jgi:hypothetical protein
VRLDNIKEAELAAQDIARILFHTDGSLLQKNPLTHKAHLNRIDNLARG